MSAHKNFTFMCLLTNRCICLFPLNNTVHFHVSPSHQITIFMHQPTDKVRKTARIRNRYNQEPHLSQDTKRESNKITINNTKKSQEVNPYPSGDHNGAMNRRKTMPNTSHINTNDPETKYRLGTVSKIFCWRTETGFTARQAHP